MATPPARTELADTYPNPSNAVFRTGIGKLWDYVTERLGASGSASDARNSLGIGNAITFRNLLFNPLGNINQRGYVSGTATTGANQYTVDRWRVVTSGQNLAFGATFTAPAGGVEQVIEGANIAAGVHTLSWTGNATATVNGAAITNGGNTASLTAGANVTVRFTGGTFSQPQFEIGTVATPFERRPFGLELSLCQRYFCKTFNYSQAPVQNVGNSQGCVVFTYGAAAGFRAQWVFPVEMRAQPSLTSYNPFAANTSWRGVAGSLDYAAAASIGIGTRQTDVGASVSAAGSEVYIIHLTANAEL